MKVPFLDLGAQYRTIQDEIFKAIRPVFERTAFAGGPFVGEFEEKFASFCTCRNAVGVGNGTDALWMALIGLGVGKGDEVITVPNTFIATAEAISFCGAEPVFVDIDEDTCTMDPSLIESAITPRTRAIIPVHLYGQPADMDPIMEIAQKYGLYVIEDACQAHGALYKGKPVGTIGDAGCFSFYPGKNLGAYGEAGAVITNNDSLAKAVRVFRDHGQARKYYHDIVGWNGRMDGIQGAILSVKLRHLPKWNEARRRVATRYGELLGNVDGIRLPVEADYAHHVYHIYAVRVEDRDAFIETMKELDIFCAIHYPVPIHLQNAYSHLRYMPGSFPVAERVSSELVSLPMYPELTDEQIEYTASETLRVLAGKLVGVA